MNLPEIFKHVGALILGLLLAAGAACAPLTLEHDPASAQASVLRAFRDIDLKAEQRRRYRLILEFGSPLFLPDADLPDPPGKQPEAGAFTLAQWRALPREQRRFDLLVAPEVDYYWPSSVGGKTVNYTSDFIIHFEPLAPMRTALHILQVNPKQRMGKKFDVLGRVGPGFYWHIRPSPPSPQAGADLAGFLAAALVKQQH